MCCRKGVDMDWVVWEDGCTEDFTFSEEVVTGSGYKPRIR